MNCSFVNQQVIKPSRDQMSSMAKSITLPSRSIKTFVLGILTSLYCIKLKFGWRVRVDLSWNGGLAISTHPPCLCVSLAQNINFAYLVELCGHMFQMKIDNQ